MKLENHEMLSSIRREIDAVDLELLAILAKRQALVERVLPIKLQEGLPARIPSRIDEVVNGAVSRAQQMGAHPDLVRTVWATMVEWFVRYEEEALRNSGKPSASAQ